MTWAIKGNDGTVKATVHALEYNGEWMGERYVTVTVESPYPIEFAIGDYLEYRGERFEINYDPGKIKSAPSYIKGDAFKYENIKFNSLADELTRCEFRDVVPSDNQIHYTSLPKFTFYGGVRDLAGRIQANLDRTYPGKWTVTVSDEYAGDKELNVSVDNQNVWDALSILVNDFETYFTINGRTITIGAAGIPAGHLFKYGKGNGLYEIEQNAEADQVIVTRLRAYGSERNLPHRYYHNLPNIDRAHADIHAVTSKAQLNNGAVDCVATFAFLDSYIDTQKCFKYTNADNETFYWLTVTLNGKSYAASVDTSKSPQQIVLGYRPPKGYSGSSNWVLHKPDMDAITSGTSVAFDCYKPTAPGIVEGQHVPNNMAVNFLMLPGFPETTLDPYIDSANIDALGVREGTVFFDGSQEGLEEIYPSIEGMTAEQLIAAGVPCISTGELDVLAGADQMTDDGIGKINESGTQTDATPPTFKVTVKDLGFDINDYIIPGNSESPTVSFKSGMLGGRNFEIVECKPIKNASGAVTGYELELNRVFDEGIKLWFPYKNYNAKAGDRFVLLYIAMPDAYIKAASQRLLEAAREWLSKNDYTRSVYAPKVDEIFMARQHDEAMASGGAIKSLHDTLKEGMLLLFEDSDLNIDASIFIDRLTIKESNGPIPTYEVTLKEEKTVGRLDRMQNQIDSLASGRGQGSGYTAAQIRSMIDAYGGERFLSKIKADRTPYRLSSDTGFEAGTFTAGLYNGTGAFIDGQGNAEFERVRVRSALEVLELIINRLSAREAEELFTESDTIESWTLRDDGTYDITIKEQYEGYFTAMTPGTVCKGIVNTLAKDFGVNGAQSTAPGKYYTSWFRVNSVNAPANSMNVSLYADTDVPGGRNYPPCELMTFARWGHQTDTTRQSCFMISSTDGRIVHLTGVTQPIIDKSNWGLSLGVTPEWLRTLELTDDNGQKYNLPLNPDYDYLYARGIVVQDLVQVDHQGKPKAEYIYRGMWDANVTDYCHETWRNGFFEVSRVTCHGCVWQCMKSGTRKEPSWNSTDWAFVEGNSQFTVDFAEGYQLYDLNNFNATLTIVAMLYNQDVTAALSVNDIEWTRYSEYADGTPRVNEDNLWSSQHASTGTQLILTRADLDVDNGYMPKTIRFTATVTWHDGQTQTIETTIGG